ncbi:MAG: hypothetical protein LZF86_110243 [Nitrospira sp.]|nr:MAG: hypothetical protein LZF86_110243 [Nitrospira sp.]
MAKTKPAALKPLLRLSKPVKATVYRAKVRQYDSVKFLDVKALARARRAQIEIGSITTPSGSATIVAEIRNGQVVGLRPKECANCKPRRKKLSLGQVKELIAQIKVKGGVTLPLPVTKTFGPMGLRIPIGPIVIVIGEPGSGLCIEITKADGTICWWCLWDPNGCMKMGPPM